MGQYDEICTKCFGGTLNDETCDTCEGYGYLLTPKGHDLIEFLKRRGIKVPMSPKAEDELRGMAE